MKAEVKKNIFVPVHVKKPLEKEFLSGKTRSKMAIFDHRGLIDFGNKTDLFFPTHI